RWLVDLITATAQHFDQLTLTQWRALLGLNQLDCLMDRARLFDEQQLAARLILNQVPDQDIRFVGPGDENAIDNLELRIAGFRKQLP
ncbi:hypothetical protein ABTM68_20190, partial [Acinetobacter baumannii]